MRKFLLIVFLLLPYFVCNSEENRGYTFDEFKNEFKRTYDVVGVPIGTNFWGEFRVIEAQYGLTRDESKLLGEWLNVTFSPGPNYNRYAFYPNKLFLLKFNFENFRVIDAEKMFFNKALGTWEIIDGTVRITIYTIITEDKTMRHPNNKGVFFVERPYSIDFVNIDDIDERGFTRRPINDTILSEELQQKVNIRWLNTTNNLYIRTVYSIDFVTSSGKPEKNYGYFSIVPELAHENISGLELATNPELIRKYIPDWWY